MTEPKRAACAGQWKLFDSIYASDHEAAAKLCATCPIKRECQTILEEELAVGRTMRSAGGGPRGTWNGQLIGAADGSRPSREHGTERGYGQHHYRREVPCDDCLEAHRRNWHESKAARPRGAA